MAATAAVFVRRRNTAVRMTLQADMLRTSQLPIRRG